LEEPLTYTGALTVIKDFQPTLSCVESVALLKGEPVLGNKIDLIIQECQIWFESFSTIPNYNPYNLTDDEIFAICIWTYDLGTKGYQEENFYYQFNKMLLKRNTKNLQTWTPYIYYLQKALSKLPDEVRTVYRGVNAFEIVEKEYTNGRRIHWSSFSSTTTNMGTAIEFSGKAGVVMKISIVNGKCIKPYSIIAREDEILLSPNMVFIVTKSIHTKDGIHFIKLQQEHPRDTFVF